MKIAILQTGRNNQALNRQFPEYPEMFETLLCSVGARDMPQLNFTRFAVLDGIFPSAPGDFDGYIITGSSAGVYEDHHWLAPLFDFIRDCHAAQIPVCGVCFGHQAVACALGGTVIKWPQGWEVGVNQMRIEQAPEWLRPSGRQNGQTVSLIYFHQDQVTELPVGAVRMAGNSFCKNAAYYIDHHIFCLQGHPEFTPSYSHALLAALKSRIGTEQTDRALSSLASATDSADAGRWIVDFFCQAHRARGRSAQSGQI